MTEKAGGSSVPMSSLVCIDPIQLALQVTAGEPHQFTLKVSVDIVGMFFIFDKRTIDEDFCHIDLPELSHEHAEILDQLGTPSRIPLRISLPIIRPRYQGRACQLVERQCVVAWRKQTVFRKGWKSVRIACHINIIV